VTQRLLWAVVESAGKIVRGSGTVSSQAFAPGVYEVIFNRDITKCAYIAVLGDPGHGVAPSGLIGVASRELNANGVFFETFNGKEEITAHPFHVAVFC
jgi:hypothetical protein